MKPYTIFTQKNSLDIDIKDRLATAYHYLLQSNHTFNTLSAQKLIHCTSVSALQKTSRQPLAHSLPGAGRRRRGRHIAPGALVAISGPTNERP